MISLIIPCYWVNQYLVDLTSICLSGLKDFPGEVIVVDDGSPIKPLFEYDVTRITCPENGGYASAVNVGLDAVDSDIIIICNNDVEFIDPEWLSQLIKPLDMGFDISSIRTTDSDGWEVEDKITVKDKFGSIWAMKKIVYETIGGLDESFGKGYFEDLDYQKRAEDAGFRVAKNHAALVLHHGKSTFKIVDTDDKAYKLAMDRFKLKWGAIW